ncbi:glycosyltransferase family 2 protein [Paenibacillus sp. GCM10023248]|uniref:glycosyltransferase family 2 protein n=1 Tax=unclassified Paenibacillus TaxID=185978 RepID=UPI0023798767|nr:glycosyltransferase [Paenibacillus sp. MAHUQ-63]MDD9268460.1 glycosyltransferase [Paenibacillus sp. MAHUQ-63]
MNELTDLFRIPLLLLNKAIFIYFIAICCFYLLLFLLSYNRLGKQKGLHKVEPYKRMKNSSFTPPLSIIVPAYNEEVGVIGTILSLITGSGRLDYPQFEVIVVNDGSKDRTLQKVIERFQMVPVKNKVHQKRNGIETKSIKEVYHSEIYPFLILIDKENGGKADALNAGINMSKYPYFASIDGDTVLDPDSFLKIMMPIVEHADDEILATGGNVLIANGNTVVKGQVQETKLSRNPLVMMQCIEYMRAFLMGRIGLSRNNLLLVISGAFGVFKTQRVIQAGGYKADTVGEDMELVVRLHRMNIEQKWGARIEYVADPICYTEAPESMKYLYRQRTRWHRGLFESLWTHRRMMFNKKYGLIGFIAMPFYFFVELLGPLVEFFGYVTLIADLIMDRVFIQYALMLFALMVVYGSFLSMGAVLLEEWRLGKYQKISELNWLLLYALSEAFWYRPLLTVWRVRATFAVLFGRTQGWGEMQRKGVSA